MIKVYYKIEFELKSPLALSSGESEETDRDLMKDSRGIPYIPASSIAGVCRGAIAKNGGTDIEYYFGNAKSENSGDVNSRIVFYDAQMQDGVHYTVSVRDSVKLDKYKVAEDGAKFDMEILESGVIFVTYLEQNLYEGDEDICKKIIAHMLRGNVFFGGKTMRGYGEIGSVKAKRVRFDLDDKEDALNWIEFDLYDNKQYGDIEIERIDVAGSSIILELQQKGGISIRKYTTRAARDQSHPEPDYEQLTVADGKGTIPVVPGTSWAGAFRHRMTELGMSEDEINKLFGEVGISNGSDIVKSRSKIRFSETQLEGADEKTITRTAIDRFTGGAKDGALYTERTYYGGKGVLKISYPSDIKDDSKKYLAAAICDLHYGLLAVGGLTAVGRGIFEISRINGNKTTHDDSQSFFNQVMAELQGGIQ